MSQSLSIEHLITIAGLHVIDIGFSISCILSKSLSIGHFSFYCGVIESGYDDIGSITSSSVPCSPKACLNF